MKTIFKRLCLWIALVFSITADGQVPNPAGPIPLVQTVPLTNAIYGRIGITNMMLLVRGDNVIGDGGGGVFAWLHGDTNTADNARYFAATNGGNWYKISYWDDGTGGGGGGGGGLGTNAFVNGVLFQPIMFTNNLSSDVGRLIWYTNANGHVVGYATNVASASSSSFVAAASSGELTNAYFQATSDIFYNVSGTNIQAYLVTEAVEDLIGASLVAGSNIAISYDDGGTGKTTISGISSGATNGTPVSVDSGGTLVAANFTDTTGINFGVSGTNVTANLTDRDWGDITTSSSGTSVAINANSVTLGTDTTGNYIATIAGTANEIDASGSGSETAGVIVSLPATIDLGGKTSFEVPNAAAPTVDAFGEVAGDNDAWAAGRGALLFYDGTAATRLVGVLASDTPSNGQVPKWNTGGTITWEDDNISGGGSGGGLGTNFVLNGVLLQPATITNGLSVIWSTNANGHAVAAVSLVETNIPSTIARLDSPTFTGTVTFDTLVANTLQFPFANSIVYTDSSSNAAPVTIGTNLTFVGGVLSGTGGGGVGSGGLGTNLFVNNILSQPAKLTNSTTIVWSTNSNGDIVATATNIAGTTTDNVLQWLGSAYFIVTNNSTIGDFSVLQTNGIVYNATVIGAGENDAPLVVELSFPTRSTNYIWTFRPEGDVNGFVAYEAEGYRTNTSIRFKLHEAVGSTFFTGGYWMRFDLYDKASVGGSGGDVTQSGNNTFTGTNTFSGTTTFNDLAIGTITVVSNLTVPNNPYGAGWNGSTNVPNENSVYDEMELRAPKASPTFSGTLTNTGSIGAPTFYIGTISQSGFTSSNIFRPNRKKVVLFEKEWVGFTLANSGLPELGGAAFASGTITAVASETNHQGLVRIVSSSSANSGYYFVSLSSQLFATPLLTWESITRVKATNAGAQMTLGFTDNAGIAAPVDGVRMWRSNNFLIPQIYANSVLAQGYEYPISSNQFVYTRIQVNTNMTSVDFYAEDSDTGTLILSTNLAGTLPASSGRVFSMGFVGGHTNSAAQNIEDIDWTTAYIDAPVPR